MKEILRLAIRWIGISCNASSTGLILVSNILIHLTEQCSKTPSSLTSIGAVPSKQLVVVLIGNVLSSLLQKDGVFCGLQMPLSTDRVQTTGIALEAPRTFVRDQPKQTLLSRYDTGVSIRVELHDPYVELAAKATYLARS